MLVITCTYGTMPDALFCGGIRTMPDAKRLLSLAVRKGYRDAEIVGEREYRERMAGKLAARRGGGSTNGQRVA
jgi:hypothetical protein